ncbi:MAG: hypothetical protein OXH38_11865 [Chloroflexi bacterium]|nr:hypothetical protein [Chloroflexota bacterium]
MAVSYVTRNPTVYLGSGNYEVVVLRGTFDFNLGPGDPNIVSSPDSLRYRSTGQDLRDGEYYFTGTAPTTLPNPASIPWSVRDVDANRTWSGTLRFSARPTTVTASAGDDQTVASGGSVALEGAATVRNGSGATAFAWRKVSGPAGDSLSSSTVARPTFRAPTLNPVSGTSAAGYRQTFVYELKATNNGVSSTDRVTITVTAPVTTVAAEAGMNKSVQSGDTVTLDGSATVQNGSGSTAYAWKKISGTGGALDDSTSATPEFTAPTLSPVPGTAAAGYRRTLVYELKATNNGVSSTDRVTITVTAPVTTVAAEAGMNKSVQSGDTVTLDGSATVRNGSGATAYAWRKVSGAGGSLDDAAIAAPKFTAPTIAPGGANLRFVYELEVTNHGVRSTDQVVIDVGAPDATIVTADAGPNREVAAGETIVLDGAGMITRPHGATTYAWVRISGTGGTLNNAAIAQPEFTAPQIEPGDDDRTIVLELQVTNNRVRATDRVTITVTAAPGGVQIGNTVLEAIDVGDQRVVVVYDGSQRIWG